MKIRVPKQIKIGVNCYQVEHLPDELFNDNEYGAAWHRKQKITIDPSSHSVQKYTTFLHEIIHLIEKSYCFRVDSDGNVDRLACGLAEFLRNNLGIELDWSDIEEEK